MATNKKSKYEACLAGLWLIMEFGAEEILLRSDSQVVISKINREYKAKVTMMQKYSL